MFDLGKTQLIGASKQRAFLDGCFGLKQNSEPRPFLTAKQARRSGLQLTHRPMQSEVNQTRSLSCGSMFAKSALPLARIDDFNPNIGRSKSLDGFGPRKKKRTLSESHLSERPAKKVKTSISFLAKPKPLPRVVAELKMDHRAAVTRAAIGMHPALMKANTTNVKLVKKMKRVEEMAQYWKRKSLNLAEDLEKSRTEISLLRGKLEGLESERLELQSKLLTAQQDSTQCMEAIKSLMSENEELKFTATNLSAEIKALEDVDREAREQNDLTMEEMSGDQMDTCKELESALEDTLMDLTERLDEIETLKAALAKTAIERDMLQKVVSKEVMQSAIASLDQDDQKEAEGKSPEQLRIERLQGQVEKCMFRIALLSQKNEELKSIKLDGSEDTALLSTLEDCQKLEILESLCMQKYRKLLRDTAKSLVDDGEQDDLMNESFD